MKKSPIAFVMFFICGAYAATHLDTENRLWFNADVVKSAIVEFVPEDKQQPTADLYQDLMDQTTGKISVDSLFKVCRKAGFNTYKYDGFTQCKSFIQKMLMDAEIAQSVDLRGFCPGLDEKGNNPNKLRSITEKTRIGDFCSSTNIRMGQVIFKPGYNCSCMASVCNPGFEFQGGACVTRIADGNGDCLREAYPKTSENNHLEKCKSFCEKKYAGRACKYTSVVMSHSTNQCICNPNSTEIDAAYESMHQAKEKQINNLKYYEVCGDHKGKSGGTEVCVEGVFNWVNIGRLQASGLAEEYARVRYKDTVHCDTVNIRTSYNDDYVKCTSMNSKRYYEFQFDDVKESIDSAIQKALVLGICKIHNVSSGVSKVLGGYSGSLKCNTACTSDMTKTARIFGLNAKTSGNTCNFSGLSMNASDAESKLAKIDGIDNYVFFHGIQIQGSQNVISQLRQYIKSTGKTVRTFDCNKNVGEIKNSLMVGDDDVLRCKLNGQPIDFVFDDFSESWLYVQEVGESKMQCIVSGGKFAGQECYGLTQKQCTDANAIYLKQNPGASGFRWDGKECVSIDANEAQVYDGAIQVGTGAIALVDCVVGTKLGCVLVMVETAGLATEMTTGVAIENRAGEFLSVSTRCKKRDCAISTIQNAGHVLSVMGALDATSLDSVDKELARLVGYLEPEDLSGVSDGDWNAIVTQLGGDPEDAGGTALVWLNRIGLGAQFLSIGASGLRLTAQAITKLAGKGSRIGRTASTVARALDTSGDAARAANNASDAARAANNTADATNAASDASRAANNANDALHANIDAVRNASNKNRARAAYHPDMYATSSASIQSKAQDIFQKLDNIDNMSDDELRALSRLMSEFDAEVAAEAAAKATAAAADVSRATYRSLDELAAADANTILRNVDNMSESDIRALTKKLTPAKRAEIAQLKMGMKPGNMTVQQFADSDDLLFIRGEFSTFDPELSRLRRAAEANKDAMADLQKYAANAVDVELLKSNAAFYQENLLRILASDESLLNSYRNFDNLSSTQKQRFLFNLLNKHGSDLGIADNVDIKFVSSFPDNTTGVARYTHINGKPTIQISESAIKQANGKTSMDKLMEAATHEFGHFVDDVSTKGVIGSQLTDAGRFFPTKADDIQGHLLYRNSPKEQSSFVIGSTVGNRFSDMLQQTLDTGKVPTTTFSKIDDFKMQHALAGLDIDITLVDNVDDAYYFIKPKKPENISGLSDYFKQKGLRVETTSDGVRIFENINPITDATRATTNAVTDGARTVNTTADAARTTSRATNAATDVNRTINTATDATRTAAVSKYVTDADADLIAKLGGADVFDSAVDGWRRDWADTLFPKSKLTDSEWNKLNQSLEKYNMEFVQGYFRNRPNDMTLVEYTPDNIRSLLEGKDIPNDAYGTLSSRPVSFKYVMDEAKTGREIFIDVGDAKEQVFQTFMRNNGLEYDLASKKVYNPSATPLQRAKGKLYTYGQTFDKTIGDFLHRNGGYPASWRRADLTDAEFDVLRADLRSRGLLLDTDPEGFLRISRISDSATNAARTTSRATNATADAARTVNASQPSTPYIPHIEIVDSSGFKYGLENFIKNPYNKSYAIRGDLIGILNREMALEDGILFMDPHYVKNNSVFASELAKQATVPNKNKIITAPVYMEMIDDAEDVLSNFVRNLDNNGIEHASIPFSSTGHSMLLVKEGKKYTILDQFGNKELKTWTSNSAKSAVRSKEKVVSALKKAGIKQDDIVLNDYAMCDNMNGTCSIYTNLSAQAALDTDGLFDLVREHNRTGGQSTRWGGDIIEDLVMESADLLVEYAKKALKRF